MIQKGLHFILLSCLMMAGCEGPKHNPLAIDDDGDGLTEFQGDCDDTNPDIRDQSSNKDCDGALTADDCDDNDPYSTFIAEDGDCDGILTADDCDDNDPDSSTTASDADCDGTPTAYDCDDNDPDSTTTASDADCDGSLTADDCDDNDASSSVIANDEDCDGIISDDDCDDQNPSAGGIADDADCDGTTAADDCDDNDSSRSNTDADDDGFNSCDNDCDDHDSQTHPGAAYRDHAEACMTDADGDGYGSSSPASGIDAGTDCDDDDPDLHHDDSDGDGLTSCDGDCDDDSESTFPGSAGLEFKDDCTKDADGDGWADDSPPDGVTAGSDCDDDNSVLNQSDIDDDGDSTCDGDCDDADATLSSLDLDGDGLTSCDGDCDDTDPSMAEPGRDDDFDGYSTCDGDCDDEDASIHPGATEIRADGIDQDCDGTEVRWSALDVASRYGCAIDTEDNIYCWGTPSSHAGDILEPPEGRFLAISTGTHHACAIQRGTRNIECWGSCLRGECDIPAGNYKEVLAAGQVESWSGSSYHSAPYTCAILDDDSIDCWGGSISPVGDFDIPTGSFSNLTARSESPCALDADGYIYCWGDRGEDDPHPTLSILSDISVANGDGCGLSYTGQPLCWGWGTYHSDAEIPDEAGFTALSVGISTSTPTACGVDSSQKIKCWGTYTSSHYLEDADLPMGDFVDVKVRHKGDLSSTSGLCACGLRTDGLIDCFGSGYYLYIVTEAPVHYAP